MSQCCQNPCNNRIFGKAERYLVVINFFLNIFKKFYFTSAAAEKFAREVIGNEFPETQKFEGKFIAKEMQRQTDFENQNEKG